MSMSMTMMVPVRPMPALGREGRRHQRPGQHIPRKGGPSAQPQHGQGIKKQNLPRDEAMCPGSQGRQAGKGQKFAQLCTHAYHLSQENYGEGPDSEALRCWLSQAPLSLSFFQHHFLHFLPQLLISGWWLLPTPEDPGTPDPLFSCRPPLALSHILGLSKVFPPPLKVIFGASFFKASFPFFFRP